MIEWILFIFLLADHALIAYLIVELRAANKRSAADVYLLADNALAYMKARSLEEKRIEDAHKAEFDVRLQLLKDNIAKEEEEKKNRGPAPKVNVVTESGETQEVSLDELDILP